MVNKCQNCKLKSTLLKALYLLVKYLNPIHSRQTTKALLFQIMIYSIRDLAQLTQVRFSNCGLRNLTRLTLDHPESGYLAGEGDHPFARPAKLATQKGLNPEKTRILYVAMPGKPIRFSGQFGPKMGPCTPPGACPAT